MVMLTVDFKVRRSHTYNLHKCTDELKSMGPQFPS